MNARRRGLTEWRDVPGYPGYRVSDQGQITGPRFPGRPLKQTWAGTPYPRLTVGLYNENGRKTLPVHQLVALAFLGPKPAGADVVRHLNDDPKDNRATNLAYGTYAENWHDSLRNGGREHAATCIRGHALDVVNLYISPGGQRHCRMCHRIRRNAASARKRGATLMHDPQTGTRRPIGEVFA